MYVSDAERHLAFRWRIVTAALALFVAFTGSVILAMPAFATQWPGPDDGAGKYAHCTVGFYYSGSSNPTTAIACQYTLGTTGSVTSNTISNIDFGTETYSCPSCSPTSASVGLSFSGAGITGPGGTSTNAGGHAIRDPYAVLPRTNTTGVSSVTLSGCSVTFSSGGTGGVPAGSVPCVVDSIVLNQASAPPLPTNNYPGASAGPAIDSSASVACDRTLTNTDAMTGQFTSTPTLANATAVSYSWVWGDSTTNGTTQNQNHTYGALSTMPTGGWTATVTLTAAVVSGHLWASDGTSGNKTFTCSLRVDFLNPDQKTAGGTGTSSSADDCPSGFGWLNPLALPKIMECLFIPSSSTTSSLSSTWTSFTTKAPFSVITDVVTYIPATIQDFRWELDNTSYRSASNGYNHNIDHSVDRSPLCDDAGQLSSRMCVGNTTPYSQGQLGSTSSGVLRDMRLVFLFLVICMFVYGIYQGCGEVIK